MKAIFIAAALSQSQAVKFINDRLLQEDDEVPMSKSVGYDVGVRFVNEDRERPGWSSGLSANSILDGVDRQQEFGKIPCSDSSKSLNELQNSWMNAGDQEVAERLNDLDQDAFVKYNANQATRAEIREFMTDAIDTEMDKFLAEKADDAAFHPEARVYNYNSPEYNKPGSEKYKIGQLMEVQLK